MGGKKKKLADFTGFVIMTKDDNGRINPLGWPKKAILYCRRSEAQKSLDLAASGSASFTGYIQEYGPYS